MPRSHSCGCGASACGCPAYGSRRQGEHGVVSRESRPLLAGHDSRERAAGAPLARDRPSGEVPRLPVLLRRHALAEAPASRRPNLHDRQSTLGKPEGPLDTATCRCRPDDLDLRHTTRQTGAFRKSLPTRLFRKRIPLVRRSTEGRMLACNGDKRKARGRRHLRGDRFVLENRRGTLSTATAE